MANADARINIVIQNERSLSRVIGKIEQVGGLLDTLNKKQLNIFGRTSGVGGDIAAKQLKNLQDNIRNVANASGDASAKARLLGNTFASVREKANAYDQVLQNVSLKNGGLSRQEAEVKNLARAWAVAEDQAETYSKRLTKIQNDALRAEKGLQPQSVRDFEVARRKRLVADRRRRISAGAAASATQAAQIRARRQRFTDVATGFGFPLLFGGGIGQAVAGGLGGAAAGLGGAIAASAVVSQVQALFDSFGELAAAMDQPVQLLEELADKGFDVGASTKSYVEALESQGRFAEAAAVANKELNKALGKDGIKAVKAYKDAQDNLKKATTDLSLEIVTKLGPAVTAFINYVTDIINRLNVASSDSAAKLKARSPEGFKAVKAEAQKRFDETRNAFGGMGELFTFDEILQELSAQRLKEIDEIKKIFQKQRPDLFGTDSDRKKELEDLKRIQQQRADLYANERPQIQAKRRFLERELEIMRMTGPLQQMEKQTAEALLKADQARFDLLQARQALRKQQRSPEFDNIKELELLNKIEEAAANSRRAEVEAEIAVEAKRVYDFYTAQADALQGIVHQSKMRLNSEKAVLEGRNKLTGAYYSAELKVNALAIQRKKQQVELLGLDGDRRDLLKLELLQVDLIYKQTVAQIKAEVEQVRLQARQVFLATKQAEVDFLRKKAKGTLVKEDYQALQLQYESLKIANYNVKVQEKVAEQQIRGAKATSTASKESLKFAYNQERAAKAANRTANAASRAARAASRSSGFSRPMVGGTGNLAINALARQASSSSVFGRNYEGAYQAGAKTQSEALRRLKMRDAYYRYKDEAAELRKVGLRAPSNPYRGFRTGGYPRFAEGGYVTRPTNALVGERGENEYVIPESKMSNAIKRYARGERGESVVEGSSETSAAGRKRSGAVVNISTGPVMQMDGQDYVTVSDLNEAVGNVAAAMSSSDSEGYGGKTRLN